MLKERYTLLRQINLALDTMLIVAAFYLSYCMRQSMQSVMPLGDFVNYAWVLLLIIPLWHLLFRMNGLYPTSRLRSIREVFLKIARSIIVGVGLLALFIFTFKIANMSRVLIIVFGLLNILFMVGKEIIVKQIFSYTRKLGKNQRNIVIAGAKYQINKLAHLIIKNEHLGLNILGYMLIDDQEAPFQSSFIKYLGHVRQMHTIIHNYPVDVLLVGAQRQRIDDIAKPLALCEEEGIELWLATDIFDLMVAKTSVDQLEGVPLIVFRTTPPIDWAIIAKRVIDFVGAGALLILLSPVFVIIAWFIKLTSPGPVFFEQERSTFRGRKFAFYKFRSMVTNAEQLKIELGRLNIMTGPVFKVKNDPRVTKVGRFLRKTSLDELPQLWNVLIGDMSLVGPRPPLPSEVDRYRNWHRRRLSMKPGLTCLWQISGRSSITDFDRWAKLDLEYIDNWSLWLDIKILLKTLPAVIKRSGAE